MHGSYILRTSAGLPTKERNTQAIALNLELYVFYSKNNHI